MNIQNTKSTPILKNLLAIGFNSSLLLVGILANSSFASTNPSFARCVQSLTQDVTSTEIASQKCIELGFRPNAMMDKQELKDEHIGIESPESTEEGTDTQTINEELNDNHSSDNLEEDFDVFPVDEELDQTDSSTNTESNNEILTGDEEISDAPSSEKATRPSFEDLLIEFAESAIRFGRQKLSE